MIPFWLWISILLLALFCIFDLRKKEDMSSPKSLVTTFYHTRELNRVTQEIFNEYGIRPLDSPEKADLYLPNGYNRIRDELIKIPPNKHQIIAGFINCDLIVAKDSLWKLVASSLGIPKASELLPMTYLLSNTQDLGRLVKDKKDDIFILKKNLQRQEGLKLLRGRKMSLTELAKAHREGFVLAQKFIDNPFCISKRKLNIRVYMLLTKNGNQCKVFVHRDGFMYYTAEDYVYSTDTKKTITTGYIKPRTFYDHNPLTQEDLRNYLGPNKSSLLFSNIYNTIEKVMKICVPKIVIGDKHVHRYQLFGVDIQVNKDLSVYLLEMNKGCSLVEMDSRDAKVKERVQRDLYSLVGVTPSKADNDFIEICDLKV